MKPTFEMIRAAQEIVYQYLKPTPLYTYAGLSEMLGCQIWVKHENHQPVGAFKVRGGLVLAAGLSDEEKAAGLFTASTGNHGQSIAYAARAHGISATIAVPVGANPGKVAAMRRMGAEVVFHGPDFDTAREWIMEVAEERGGNFIGPTDPPLMCGVGTLYIEIMESLPEVDVIIVPVGGGSSASAACLVANHLKPDVQVIGCQSAQAPAAQMSWKSGTEVEAAMKTFAEGVATRVGFANTQGIMREYLHDFVLVDDADIATATCQMIAETHNLIEEASGLTLAATHQLKDKLAGKNVVLVASGGNISLEKLKKILDLDK